MEITGERKEAKEFNDSEVGRCLNGLRQLFLLCLRPEAKGRGG